MGFMRSQEKKQKINSFQKPTIKDIARIANVSETTVSLSFKNNSRISDKTRQKVLNIAKELNYFPNLSARDLRAGRTKTIGFVINDIKNPFYGSMVRTSEQIALERGYEVIFSESQWSGKNEKFIINRMLQNQIEGIILCFSEKTESTYKTILSSGIPHIVVDTKPDYYHGPYVINDSAFAGYLAVKHLYDIGCRNIAVLNAKEDLGYFSSVNEMEHSISHVFNSITQKERIQIDFYDSGLKISSGMKTYDEMQKAQKFYDGIFCMNDLCAMGYMNAALRDGLQPGKDFAIVGVDDNEVSDLDMISLTSINIDYEEISKIATNYLIDVIENKQEQKIEKMIRPELIIRNSSSFFQT